MGKKSLAPVMYMRWQRLPDGTDAGVRVVRLPDGRSAAMPTRVFAEAHTSDGRSVIFDADSTDDGEIELRALTITKRDGSPLSLPDDAKVPQSWLEQARDSAIVLLSSSGDREPMGPGWLAGRALIDRLNEQRRPGRKPPDRSEVIKAGELRAAGLTYTQIADKLDIGKSTAERWVRQAQDLIPNTDQDE